MPDFRNVFFSFHYADVMLASQVRNCDQFFADRMSFRDWAEWESVRLRSDAAIRDWIEQQLDGTSVTVVLIGAHTATRQWVHYEIIRSVQRGNGLVGIYLNKMRAPRHLGNGPRGHNPFLEHKPRPRPAAPKVAAAPLTSGIIDRLRDAGLRRADDQTTQLNALASLLGSGPGAMPLGGILDSFSSTLPSTPAAPPAMVPVAPPRNTFVGMIPPPPSGNALREIAGLGMPTRTSAPQTLADQVRCYCWENENGHSNIAAWIERAAKAAGR